MQPGLWTPSASAFVLQQPSQKLEVEAEQGSVCCWSCWGSGKGTGHPCTGGGSEGRSGGLCCRPQPAALILGLSRHKGFRKVCDNKCSFQSPASYMVISLHYSDGGFKTALLPSPFNKTEKHLGPICVESRMAAITAARRIWGKQSDAGVRNDL